MICLAIDGGIDRWRNLLGTQSRAQTPVIKVIG